jgi:3-hydroxybutyryl-CoA dehydrogenase
MNETTKIVRVGVIGGGQMGAGIAEVCARAGVDVLIAERTGSTARDARERVTCISA